MPERILRHETFLQACQALEGIALRHPKVAKLVAETTIGHKRERVFAVWACQQPNCQGEMHCAGRELLEGSRPGMKSLFVCAMCGHSEIRLN